MLEHSIVLCQGFQFTLWIKEEGQKSVTECVAQPPRLLIDWVSVSVLFRQLLEVRSHSFFGKHTDEFVVRTQDLLGCIVKMAVLKQYGSNDFQRRRLKHPLQVLNDFLPAIRIGEQACSLGIGIIKMTPKARQQPRHVYQLSRHT